MDSSDSEDERNNNNKQEGKPLNDVQKQKLFELKLQSIDEVIRRYNLTFYFSINQNFSF